jgi:uncharacterized protein (TIRG00374 family)
LESSALIGKKSNKKKSHFKLTPGLKLFIRWTLGIVCLGYVVFYFINNKEDILVLKQIEKLDLFVLLTILVIGHFIYAIRMRIILEKNSQTELPFWPWLKIFFVSRFISLYAGQAGNVYRGVVLKKNHRVSYTNYISSYFFINWIDLAMGLVYGIIIVTILKPGLKIYNINGLLLMGVLLLSMIILPLMVLLLLPKIKTNIRFLNWIHERFTEMLSTAVYSFNDLSYILKILISGMLAFFNIILVIYICFRAINVMISLDIAIFYKIITNLLNKIIITPSNVGVREIVYGILSKEFEIGMSQGMLVSLIIRAIGIIIITVLGLAIGGTDIFKTNKEIKEISSENQI